MVRGLGRDKQQEKLVCPFGDETDARHTRAGAAHGGASPPFTVGTIEGLLTDFVRCIREQLLAGNSVKIGDLAIFKLSTESRPYADVGGLDAVTGQFAAQARVGSAVKSVKLLATATGRSMRAPLGRDVELAWSTEARAMMEERRREVIGEQNV